MYSFTLSHTVWSLEIHCQPQTAPKFAKCAKKISGGNGMNDLRL